MKIVIEIPEKTNAHIRSDYGHCVRGLRIEDMEMLVDAVYHGEPYHNRPHGEWIDRSDGGRIRYPFWERYECSKCGSKSENTNFCPNCGADMRKEGDTSEVD